MTHRAGTRRGAFVGSLGFAGALLAACSPQSVAQERGGKVRLSIATGGTGGVYYPYGGGLAKVIGENVKGAEATAEVTSASVDNMKFVKDGKADVAFTLADTLDDAAKGQEAFKEFGKVPAQALAVLYTNFTHVIALADKGINKIADLKGKVVSTGAAGSGTEIIAFRMLEAAGLKPQSDVQKQSLNAQPSVDAMKDGKIDAFFWSGGLPTPAVTDLANTQRVRWKLLPNDDVLAAMQKQYGQQLYYKTSVAKTTYPGMDADVSVIGVANVLVVNEKMEESLAYDITKVLFDKQTELAAIHPEARNLKLESAIVGSPVAFHKGAIRFYREKKVWKG
jgi:uncharacterized protein